MTINLSALQKQRRDSAANWTAENPTLLAGEIGIESDTGYWKVGDGSTAWTSLAYVSGLGAEIPVDRLADGTAGQIIQTDSAGTGVEWSSTANLPLGSASAPAYRFQGDPNTGIYSPGADEVAISSNGVGRLFVDASGNVGLGTANPGNYADNADNFVIYENGNSGMTIAGSTTGKSSIYFADAETGSGASVGLIQYDHTDNYLRFNTNTTERLRITSDGKLGLGTSTPGYRLDVTSQLGCTYSGALRHLVNIDSDGGKSYWYNGTPTNTAYIAGDTGSAYFAGNVGIGTTSPASLLHLYQSGSTTNVITQYQNGTASAFFGVRGSIYKNLAAGDAYIYQNGNDIGFLADSASSSIKFAAGGQTESARIDSSGRLLVGTSSARSNFFSGAVTPYIQQEGANNNSRRALSLTYGENANSSAILAFGKHRSGSVGGTTIVNPGDVLGTVTFQGSDGTNFLNAAQITADVDGTPGVNVMPGRLVFSSNPGAPATSPSEAMRINSAQELLIGYTSDNGAYKLQVNSQIFATSATIATSDGRYKENVASLGGCLDLVKALRPVSFTWKPQEDITRIDDEGNEVLVREGHNFPEGTQVGFIAQEVQEVLDGKPWLGSVIKENIRPAVKDNDGNELAPEEQFYGIAEGNLIAVLTNALQEAVGRIEALEAEVAALKA